MKRCQLCSHEPTLADPVINVRGIHQCADWMKCGERIDSRPAPVIFVAREVSP